MEPETRLVKGSFLAVSRWWNKQFVISAWPRSRIAVPENKTQSNVGMGQPVPMTDARPVDEYLGATGARPWVSGGYAVDETGSG